jgi:hypothetical protein
MAGERGQPGTLASTLDDLIQPRRREWLASMWSFEHNKDVVSVGLRTLGREVTGKAEEEARRDGYESLVTTLALGDKHSPLARLQVLEAQTEDFATS